VGYVCTTFYLIGYVGVHGKNSKFYWNLIGEQNQRRKNDENRDIEDVVLRPVK
jgi:hypothetical protein